MKINTKFNLFQKVYITELKLNGLIIGVFIDTLNNYQYRIRYFNGLDDKTVYFYENELEEEKPKESIGLIPK